MCVTVYLHRPLGALALERWDYYHVIDGGSVRVALEDSVTVYYCWFLGTLFIECSVNSAEL